MQEVLGQEVMGKATLEDIDGGKPPCPVLILSQKFCRNPASQSSNPNVSPKGKCQQLKKTATKRSQLSSDLMQHGKFNYPKGEVNAQI